MNSKKILKLPLYKKICEEQNFKRSRDCPLKRVFFKNGSYDFFKNTHFGMWKWSPKTPHTQFLCRVQFHKLPLKTHRESHKQVIFRIPPPMKLSIQNALLTSFLNGFRRIIACWKGLELRSSNTLPDITIGKALHVMRYKIKNMHQKMR